MFKGFPGWTVPGSPPEKDWFTLLPAVHEGASFLAGPSY